MSSIFPSLRNVHVGRCLNPLWSVIIYYRYYHLSLVPTINLQPTTDRRRRERSSESWPLDFPIELPISNQHLNRQFSMFRSTRGRCHLVPDPGSRIPSGTKKLCLLSSLFTIVFTLPSSQSVMKSQIAFIEVLKSISVRLLCPR